jgi:phosphoribosyl-ATP pyrophosphohydrolase
MAKKTTKPVAAKPKPAVKAKAPVKTKASQKVKAKPAARALPVLVPGPENASDARILDRLWTTVLSRKDADPATSHSARLLSRGTAKIAQKFGEEAVECLIEAVAGQRGALVAESADVLYHLLVIWVDAGLRPELVWAELERREGMSGIAEKASRRTTTKIP